MRCPGFSLRAIALAALLGATACVPSMRSSFRDGSELASRVVDAAGLATLELDAGVGEVDLSAIDVDSVRVEVVLRSSDAARLERECRPNSSLVVDRRDDVLVVRVDQRTGDKCGTRWRVGVPARLATRVTSDVGKVTIDGVAGAIDVNVGNGDAEVRSRAPGHGAVLVRTNVGRVRVRIAGYDATPPKPPGSGHTVRLDGPGGPAVTIRVGVGNASLDLAGAAPTPDQAKR